MVIEGFKIGTRVSFYLFFIPFQLKTNLDYFLPHLLRRHRNTAWVHGAQLGCLLTEPIYLNLTRDFGIISPLRRDLCRG